MISEMEKINEAANYIRMRLQVIPRFGIILGSGLGLFADQLNNSTAVNFSDIPHFPQATVDGHKGRLVTGWVNDVSVMVLQGRLHYYEGYTMDQVVFPLRCMLSLGITNLVVTNAAGSVDLEYRPGELMLIRDHISFCAENPLRGENFTNFGPRFKDMSDPYTSEIRELAKECGREIGISLKEGVYFYMPGPSYETASEIRAINLLGGHVVGMSTVPEAVVAAHGGMNLLGISCITNMGTGIVNKVIGHDEVVKTGEEVAEQFVGLLGCILSKWHEL